MRLAPLLLTGFCLSACSNQEVLSPQEEFFTSISAFCGKSFAGKLVSNDEVDADFASQSMVMEVRECSDKVIRIPFHVGDDHSRTWVISKTDTGLRLKHDHRHEDGTEDKLTQYGGDTIDDGMSTFQSFPADGFSKEMFTREGIPVSNDNIWTIKIEPGVSYTYGLARPNRDFRVEFDLTAEVATPPAPWGSN